MTLSTAHVADSDLGVAAEELLLNVRRLTAAGKYAAALDALTVLVTPGPWRLAQYGSAVTQLDTLLPLLCHLNDQPCPAFGTTQAQPPAALAERMRKETRTSLNALKMPIRHQRAEAGANWHAGLLHGAHQAADETQRRKEFNTFCIDVEFVLKDRLAQHFPAKAAPSIEALMAMPQAQADCVLDGLDLADLMAGQTPIAVAAHARGIPTAAIAAALGAYMDQYQVSPNYMTSFLFQAILLLGLLEGEAELARTAAVRLASEDSELHYLISLAAMPLVHEFLASGACAAALGIDDAQAQAYLSALSARPDAPSHADSSPGFFSGDTLDSFKQLLQGTAFADRNIVELPILDSPEKAYVLAVGIDEMEDLWRTARGLVPQTGRWPLITTSWAGQSPELHETLINADLFGRFSYQTGPDADDISPRAIVARAGKVDLTQFLAKKSEQREGEMSGYATFDQSVDDELFSTQRRCGAAPAREDVLQAQKEVNPEGSACKLDRWLMDWESQCGAAPTEQYREPWFVQDPMLLIFLPTPEPWDALAYLHWYGSEHDGTESHIAMGRHWQQEYGAELFAHFGTMLECFVSRPPTTMEEAWQLAREHDLIAPCTLALQGTALRHYAAELLNYDRWFLHERP